MSKTTKTDARELEVLSPLPPAVNHYTQSHPGALCVLLQPNAAKVETMQPALLGSVRFGDDTFRIAGWWNQTRDGARDYYTLSIEEEEALHERLEEDRKPAPGTKAKLWQFRQQSAGDPDYASPEPFRINDDALYWLLFWVHAPEDFPADPSEQDLHRVIYALVFSHTRPAERMERMLVREMEDQQKFLRERRRELEARRVLQAKRAKEIAE
jgi:hypothetical protein